MKFPSLDKHDKYTVYSFAAGLAVWWLFIGRKKYGVRGVK